MALTLTNTLVLLITGGDYATVRGLDDLPGEGALYSTLLVVNLIRFYHGNMRHLDVVYLAHPESDAPPDVKPQRGNLGLDFFVIFGQSVLFAVTSFYASGRQEFILLFIILLFVDIVWIVSAQQQAADERAFTHQRRWMLNNLCALVGLLLVYAGVPGDDRLVYLYVAGGIIAVNTILDFAFSWHFYFPRAPLRAGLSPQ